MSGPEGRVETEDVQSLLLAGYPDHDGAVFLRMDVESPGSADDARRSLAKLVNDPKGIGFGRSAKREEVVHLAFSAKGLAAVGLDEEVIDSFPLPFLEGMGRRSVVLGDVGDNRWGLWKWGGRSGLPDALVLVYAKEQAAAEERARALGDESAGWSLAPLPTPSRLRLSGERAFREHFGFVDGIANPRLVGLDDEDARPENAIAPGEFLLGYTNESDEYPASPRVAPGGGRGTVLPDGDFGRNGSFLVVRQLEQDVAGFWSFLLEQADKDRERAIWMASKMVGRWRNGAPLTRWRRFEPPGEHHMDDDFLYAGDERGFGCPIGSHVRRTNPRDASPKLSPALSLASTRKRRLLRRGRSYGPPFPGWPDPAKIVEAAPDGQERGLHFLCFCANLVDQFEFVQQSWVNARHFGGLVNDPDPLLCNESELGSHVASDFTIQDEPLSRRIHGLRQFVTLRGGGYFFMPGRRALRYIAG